MADQLEPLIQRIGERYQSGQHGAKEGSYTLRNGIKLIAGGTQHDFAAGTLLNLKWLPGWLCVFDQRSSPWLYIAVHLISSVEVVPTTQPKP